VDFGNSVRKPGGFCGGRHRGENRQAKRLGERVAKLGLLDSQFVRHVILDSAESRWKRLFHQRIVAFTPSARVEAIISVCWAEKSLVAFSTIALI